MKRTNRFYGREVLRVGNDHRYIIFEGYGPDGGRWLAEEQQPSVGFPEVVTFDSLQDAVEHAEMSND